MLLRNYNCLDVCKSSAVYKGIACGRVETIQEQDLDQSSFNINLQDQSYERLEELDDSFDDMKIEVEIPSER